MRSAARLYLMQVVLGVVGLAVLVVALRVASSAIRFDIPSGTDLARACGSWLPALSLAGWLALALLVLGAVAIARGLRSLLNDVISSRRYLGGLPTGPMISLDAVPVILLEDEVPFAFCAGFLRPRIYLSRGAMRQLDWAERRAVLAHELHHRQRRDPLRILAARALAATLFFLPVLRFSSERYAALGELAADEAAVRKAGDRRPLAAALLKFDDAVPYPLGVGVAAERVDYLAGERAAASWRLSAAAIGASIAMLGALLVLVALAAHSANKTGLALPLLLVQSCTLAMTAGPAALAAGLWMRIRARAANSA